MCPLRFILVFFSAVLAGFFAWRTVRSSPEELDQVVSDDSEKTTLKEKEGFNLKRVCLVFVVFFLFVVFVFCLCFCFLILLLNCRWFRMVSGYLLTWPVGGTCGGI